MSGFPLPGPNLLAADQDAAYGDALTAAVAEARAKAQTLASSTGMSPGRITGISEGGGAPQPLCATAGARDAAVSIEPGTREIEATVSVTFAVG
jgi:uncharacterized protein YggE